MTKREPLWRRYDRFFGLDRRADAEDELAFHYDMRVRDYMSRGMDEHAAREAANERIGSLDRIKAECAALGDTYTRDDRRREWFGELRQDMRYGLRTLLRAPVFSVVAILTLALSIGATTTIFSVVHRVLIAPLPYTDSDRLVRIYERAPQGRNDKNPVSAGNYTDWSARTRSFSAIGAFSDPASAALTGDGDPVQITTVSLTPSAMTALGVRPRIGRLLTDRDAEAGGVVLVSEGFWRRRFGADPTVLGKLLTIDGVDHAVIGVLPANIDFPTVGVDVWRPILATALDPERRRSHNYGVIARLAPGVTLAQAQKELTALAQTIAADYPQDMTGWGVNITSLHGDLVAEARPLLLVLIGAVGVMLLIACGNLANLLLARAVAREREMVLRGALGAGRARLIRQLLTEALLIALLGGVLGIAVAAGSLQTLLALAPPMPMANQTRMDWVVVAFAAGLTLCSTMLFGLAPAFRLASVDMQSTLRAAGDSTGGTRHSTMRGMLLVGQIALSVVLLVSAGLLVRSFQRLHAVDLGFRPDGLAVMSIDLPAARYQNIPSQIQFYDALLDRLRNVPGVRGVAGASMTPASGAPTTWSFAIEDRPATNPSGREDPEPVHFVAGAYFNVLGIPLMQGRVFDSRDHDGTPAVVVINESLAKMHWQGEDPVGKRISLTGAQGPWVEIVGVVGDTRMQGIDNGPEPAMYMPYDQKTFPWLSWMGVVVRTDPGFDAVALLPALRAALWQIDPRLPVQKFARIGDLYRDTIARRSFAMALVTGFGLLALLLCVMGLYGLISYTVAQQRREIGVRIALGASIAGVVRGVLTRSVRLALVGIAIGLIGALAATRLLGTLLYDISPLDIPTFITTAAVVLVVAICAASVPALRAARTSPLLAVRG